MKNRLFLAAFFAALFLPAGAHAQSGIVSELKPAIDSVNVLLRERTTVRSTVRLNSASLDGKNLSLRFSEELSDWHWSKDDQKWFASTIESLLPDSYKKCKVTNITCDGTPFSQLVTSELSNNGKPAKSVYATDDPKTKFPFIEKVGGQEFNKGLSGRYIALWQSHGRYFDEGSGRWENQRATVQTTIEDMYTQSYVLPFLIPMLENAGAYVLTPRERDINTNEYIIDNDPHFGDGARVHGTYHETGTWGTAGAGFADAKEIYHGNDNPFLMGSVRSTESVQSSVPTASATYQVANIEKGITDYAVYVSYKSLENSSEAVHYTVNHAAGKSEFIVNQKIGGGTWIYLGSFPFDGKSSVVVDNALPAGRKFKKGVVTTDAVKIGGGVGKIARGRATDPVSTWTTSGVPAYLEGALYWEQYAGIDSTVIKQWDGDYTRDYASRGAWVKEMKARGVPFDLSFAFHTDAGVTPDDNVVGTLAIYTLLEEGSRKYTNGRDRMVARELTDLVQTQIVNDVRTDFNPNWSRRQLWNRSYSESRTTDVPGMLLELLSHQNLADMKYGLDPKFRFTVSRAIYKGMLKFLADEYNVRYVVQPLPVDNFSASLSNGNAVLSWKPVLDEKEPTAAPEGYIVYTRVGDGPFDAGQIVKPSKAGDALSVTLPIEKGKLYSYKVVAFNEGGKSFPSEILCVGQNDGKQVLVVNNFDRLAPPAWFDSEKYAGFNGQLDGGVDYGIQINYIGDVFDFRREAPYINDDASGFGASYTNFYGKNFMGNNFDYVSVHAAAAMKAGYSVSSMSNEALGAGTDTSADVLDLLCGKQVTTMVGDGTAPAMHSVFPENVRAGVTAFAKAGKGILVSGSNIATDLWDQIYECDPGEEYRAEGQKFAQDVLGWKWQTGQASSFATMVPVNGFAPQLGTLKFANTRNSQVYQVENPDGINPAADGAKAIFMYEGSLLTAGVKYDAGTYKAISFGFPLETLLGGLDELMAKSLDELVK